MTDRRKTIIDFRTPKTAPAEKRPSLVVLTGKDIGRQYFLVKGETSIGREASCNIELQDVRVSRRHAKVVGDPGKASGPYFKIVDLGSTNGTFLNDKRIKEAVLTEGDRIHIGYTVFKYTIRDVAEVEYENKIYRMATTDALTGLYSRDYFLQQYSDTFHRSDRYQRPFSLMLIDIDDFKSVNDTYGHPVGDLVLEGVGRMILEVVRHEDCAARYGGEEFAILLPETTPEKALHPAERLRRSLEAYTFKAEENRFSVTVSIGIAGYPNHGSTLGELVENADRALYRAKSEGKNTVCVFKPDTTK